MAAGGLSLAALTAAVSERVGGKLAARIDGDAQRRVSSVAALSAAAGSQLSFLANPRYRDEALASAAGAIVLTEADAAALREAARSDVALVIVDQPYAWFALAAQLLHPAAEATPGIDPGAHVDAGARVDASASVGPGASVGRGARVGAQAIVDAGAVLGADAVLGAGSRLYPNAVVLDRCEVGARCVVHSGAVIGADGFGFAPFEGQWIKIPQLGRVVIEDDVEIGANTTVDRGTTGDTRIGRGAKLDNQIQVGHNCVVGEYTVIAGCVGIAGSARIGAHCQIGGAAMIAGHLSIADGCAIGPGTLVASSIDKPGHYTGFFPMMPHRDWEHAAAIIRRIDQLRDELRRRVRELEAAQRRERS